MKYTLRFYVFHMWWWNPQQKYLLAFWTVQHLLNNDVFRIIQWFQIFALNMFSGQNDLFKEDDNHNL